MQWTVQVVVALLNVVWVVFFLQHDPFSVSVQRRSSDSSDKEMLFGEFCIQPRSDMNQNSTLHTVNGTTNETNSINKTAEATDETSPCLRGFSLDTPASSHSPQTCRDWDETTPPVETQTSSEVDVRVTQQPKSRVQEKDIPLGGDWDETTPASPPVERPTASGLISKSSSDAAHVRVTHRSKPPIREGDNRYECCFSHTRSRIPSRRIKGYKIQRPSRMCRLEAIIFYTSKGRTICIDPSAEWVQQWLLKNADKTK